MSISEQPELVSIFDGLNEKQKEAVCCDKGIVRVNAGAGTGKTKVLISRLAFLIKNGVPVEKILSVTFTNKAAGEMKDRAKKMLNTMNFTPLICTFHGFCCKLLKEEMSYLNWTSNSFTIMSEEDQDSCLEEIFENHRIHSKMPKYTFKRALRDIELYKEKNTEFYIDYMTNPSLNREFVPWDGKEWEDEKKLKTLIIKDYLKKQRQCCYLDFNDLIFFAIHLLKRFSEVKKRWNDQLDFIQVDEFQDVSRHQYELLQLLWGHQKYLFAVGDPDQNIYEWRGSKSEYFEDLEALAIRSNTSFQNIVLDENYRSGQPILNISNRMISRLKRASRKELHAVKNKSRNRPVYVRKETEAEELDWLSDQIKKLTESIQGKNIAVLTRVNSHIDRVARVLEKKDIRYRIICNQPFVKRKGIRDAIAFLSLIANQNDDIAFDRIINVPHRGMSESKRKILKQYSSEHNCSLFEALSQNLNEEAFSEDRMKEKMPDFQSEERSEYHPLFPSEFVNLISRMNKKSGKTKLIDILDCVLKESGYEQDMMLRGDEEQKDNIAELKSLIEKEEREAEENLDVQAFLAKIACEPKCDERDKKSKGKDDDNAVNLLTVHAAKGLEFKYVFIPFFNDEIFPQRKKGSSG